jgi:hypothetical protein
MRKSRALSPFGMSFLDIMFCGFGAVVLLVVLLNGDTLRRREVTHEDLRDELKRVTALLDFARAHVAELSDQVGAVEREDAELAAEASRLEGRINEASRETQARKRSSAEAARRIEVLGKQREALVRTQKLLESRNAARRPKRGKNPVGFDGDGRRQYLTGLKLGGDRTLILLDSSASMLDETVVNVVRRKLMPAEQRRRAPKWRRAVRTLDWLVANLRPDRRFQVYHFNTEAAPVIAGTDGRWLSTNDGKRLAETIAAARRLAPGGGTSLHKAFAAITAMVPKPDSVVLLTDGLPTQGASPPSNATISGKEREELFEAAVARLAKRIPVNTLLFPFEGDPAAAAAFWRLAIRTSGSFITPSRDWP